jgi:hypothetical protein
MGDVMLNDMELLRDYAAEGSQTSFRTILDPHVALVYSAALRQVRDLFRKFLRVFCFMFVA